MQGNGTFVLDSDPPPPVTVSIKLELRQNGYKSVFLVASLGDGTEAYLACFKDGACTSFYVPQEVAARLGIRRNLSGTMMQEADHLSSKSNMGC